MSTLSNGLAGQNGVDCLEFERPLAKLERQIEELESTQGMTGQDHSAMIRSMRSELLSARRRLYSRLDAWPIQVKTSSKPAAK